LGAACAAAGAVLRAVLWWRFGLPAGVSGWTLPAIMAGGLLNDLVVTFYLLAPLVIYISCLPDRWYDSRANRWLLAAGSWLTLALIAFLAFAELYFFEEFDARFNLVAFDYLAYPTEVAGDLWQEYPVLRVALVSAFFATAALWMIRSCLSSAQPIVTSPARRLQPLALHSSALLLLALFYQTDLLSLSSNRVANELVQNGISSFFRAVATSEIDYHAYYRSADPDENLALVAGELGRGGGEFTRLSEGRLDRAFPARANGLGKLNVVLVSSESFGAEFSRLYGSARDLTPNFDALAQQGLWFSRTYASGTRTVRGLEALVSSIPPIPTVSILRRPGNEGVATWGAVMRSFGYHTSFLYGGYGYFDNMNHFFGSNGFEVLDRNSIDSVRFENIWGISDEDLFDRSLTHFDALHAAGEPFFSIIMTTSNHKPFTFRPGLEKQGIPETGGGRAAGVRYADYALGQFIRQAQDHSWFDDTVFVVVADHGARVYGVEQIPLKTYEIPLMIYSPSHIKPKRVDTLMTQIDVAPTVLGLLGLPYEAPFFGQDVLSTPTQHRIAFFNHNHDVAIYRDGHLVVFGLKNAVSHFHYDPATNIYEPAAPDTGLERLGIAYYQTAYELFEAHLYEPADESSEAYLAARHR
jgi:phosphoglycerol transferase MdoB-like AlkP superfamily enzyme